MWSIRVDQVEPVAGVTGEWNKRPADQTPQKGHAHDCTSTTKVWWQPPRKKNNIKRIDGYIERVDRLSIIQASLIFASHQNEMKEKYKVRTPFVWLKTLHVFLIRINLF